MKMLRRLGHGLALYLDDLLLLAGCGCFVRAAWEAWGRPAAWRWPGRAWWPMPW